MLKEVEVQLQNGGSASNLLELDTNKLKTKAASSCQISANDAC